MTATVSINSSGPGVQIAAAPAKKARDASAAGFDSVLAQQGLPAEPNRPLATTAPDRGGEVTDGKKPVDGGAETATTYGPGGDAVAGPAALIRSILTGKGAGNAAPAAGRPAPQTVPTATAGVDLPLVIPGTPQSTVETPRPTAPVATTQPGAAAYPGVPAAKDGPPGTPAPMPAGTPQSAPPPQTPIPETSATMQAETPQSAPPPQTPIQETPATGQPPLPDPQPRTQDVKADTPQTPPSTPAEPPLSPMDLAAPPVVSGEAAAHGTGTSRLARTGIDSATGAGSTDEGGSADLTNPGRQVTRQVGAHLLRQLGVLDGRGTLRLTLNPEHLGRVEITFVRDGRDLNLTFRAEAAGSAEALRSGAGELQTLLLDKGGEWDRVAVRVESDEKPDDSDDAADSRQHREERDRSSEQEGTPS